MRLKSFGQLEKEVLVKAEQRCPSIQYLIELAQRAGAIMKQRFVLGMNRQWKSDGTPCADADLTINALVLAAFRRDFPHICVVSEEGNREVPDADYLVFCDPVDGTIPFSLGLPIATFCISVVLKGRPILAAIHDPFNERTWFARQGRGAFLNGNSISVSAHSELIRSQLCLIWWKDALYNLQEASARLMETGAQWIHPSSVGIFGGLIASGTVHASIFPGQQAWETSAMDLIVTEAGGCATDIHGKPLQYAPQNKISGHIISNGFVHQALIDLVASCQI